MPKIDVADVVGAVTREVRSVTREGRDARVVVATRSYATDIADTWDALTNPLRIPRWFMPIEGELRQGGHYQLKGNAGGTITTCEPPRNLALTWEYAGDVSWVAVSLTPIGAERTLLVLEHTAYVDEARWGEFGPGAVGVGWDLGLLGLSLHLEGGGTAEDVTREGQAWAASDEGKRCQRMLSDDWCRASIAAGTDPKLAREAADRTSAAYTGSA